MSTNDSGLWRNRAAALAFCGNSLLATVHQTGEFGLDPAFWADFTACESDEVAAAADACGAFAGAAADRAAAGEDPATDASVEFTRLFVGPPSPAAAPWETFYRGANAQAEEGARVGFGEATVDMQRRLADAGLQVSNENNQYADHMGIELLLASVLCERIADALEGAAPAADADSSAAGEPVSDQLAYLDAYLNERPLSWMADLRAAVEAAAPGGYIARILALADAMLRAISA